MAYKFALRAGDCKLALNFETAQVGHEPERAAARAALGGPTFSLPETGVFPPTVFVNVSNASAMAPGWTWWSNFPGGAWHALRDSRLTLSLRPGPRQSLAV